MCWCSLAGACLRGLKFAVIDTAGRAEPLSFQGKGGARPGDRFTYEALHDPLTVDTEQFE